MTPDERGELTALLTTEHTAKDLARALRCSLPTIYRRIALLQEDGVAIRETRTQEQSPGSRKKTGPPPTRYTLRRKAAISKYFNVLLKRLKV